MARHTTHYEDDLGCLSEAGERPNATPESLRLEIPYSPLRDDSAPPESLEPSSNITGLQVCLQSLSSCSLDLPSFSDVSDMSVMSGMSDISDVSELDVQESGPQDLHGPSPEKHAKLHGLGQPSMTLATELLGTRDFSGTLEPSEGILAPELQKPSPACEIKDWLLSVEASHGPMSWSRYAGWTASSSSKPPVISENIFLPCKIMPTQFFSEPVEVFLAMYDVSSGSSSEDGMSVDCSFGPTPPLIPEEDNSLTETESSDSLTLTKPFTLKLPYFKAINEEPDRSRQRVDRPSLNINGALSQEEIEVAELLASVIPDFGKPKQQESEPQARYLPLVCESQQLNSQAVTATAQAAEADGNETVKRKSLEAESPGRQNGGSESSNSAKRSKFYPSQPSRDAPMRLLPGTGQSQTRRASSTSSGSQTNVAEAPALHSFVSSRVLYVYGVPKASGNVTIPPDLDIASGFVVLVGGTPMDARDSEDTGSERMRVPTALLPTYLAHSIWIGELKEKDMKYKVGSELVNNVPGFLPRHDRYLQGDIKFKAAPPPRKHQVWTEETLTKLGVDLDGGLTITSPAELPLTIVAAMLNRVMRRSRGRFLAVCPQFIKLRHIGLEETGESEKGKWKLEIYFAD